MDSIQLQLVFGFVLLPLLCILLERLWPSLRDYQILRPGLRHDAIWYMVQTFVARILAPWIVYVALIPVVVVYGMTDELFYVGFGPVATLPFWAQTALLFVCADFLSYWQHRIFHTRHAWPIHAVHHSSENLDWLSSTRFHPLNEIGAQLIYAAPLLACGFSPLSFVVLAPFTTTYAVILHANLRWTFGPLRYVIASPIFHRWHHTSEAEGRDKNFAGFLPVWDLIFGTFYMPKGSMPVEFGVEEPVPEGFAGQFEYPFRRYFGGADAP